MFCAQIPILFHWAHRPSKFETIQLIVTELSSQAENFGSVSNSEAKSKQTKYLELTDSLKSDKGKYIQSIWNQPYWTDLMDKQNTTAHHAHGVTPLVPPASSTSPLLTSHLSVPSRKWILWQPTLKWILSQSTHSKIDPLTQPRLSSQKQISSQQHSPSHTQPLSPMDHCRLN